MSDKKVKVVRMHENKLVDIIDGLVNEEVAKRKVTWLAEQKAAKETLIESEVANLKKVVAELTKAGK